MNEPCAGFDQRAEEDKLERNLKASRSEPLEKNCRGYGGVHDLRVHADHGQEEEKARNHRDGAGEGTRDQRLLSRFVQTQSREDRRNDSEVVPSVPDTRPRPPPAHGLRSDVLGYRCSELPEAPHEEDQIEPVQYE